MRYPLRQRGAVTRHRVGILSRTSTLTSSHSLQIPLNAVLVSLLVTSLLSLINIGSYVALNAILSLTAVSLLTSYIIVIGCLVLKRLRGQPLPARRWSLGRWGLPINIAALCFLAPSSCSHSPRRNAGRGRFDELGDCHVCWHYGVRDGVLSRAWT